MKANIAFAEDVHEEGPDLGFSQVTSQRTPLRKSKICACKSVPSVVAAGGHEQLISKPKLQCIAEKTSVVLGSIPAHLEAIQRLTKMELRARYKSEATAHRNMKGRAKTKGAVIHPEFHKFEDFLRHLGPCPANRATVDRINNSDPEYAPGKVRWADKRSMACSLRHRRRPAVPSHFSARPHSGETPYRERCVGSFARTSARGRDRP